MAHRWERYSPFILASRLSFRSTETLAPKWWETYCEEYNVAAENWQAFSWAYWAGVPAAIAAELIAEGKYLSTGALAPEAAFEPEVVFAKLAAYDLRMVGV